MRAEFSFNIEEVTRCCEIRRESEVRVELKEWSLAREGGCGDCKYPVSRLITQQNDCIKTSVILAKLLNYPVCGAQTGTRQLGFIQLKRLFCHRHVLRSSYKTRHTTVYVCMVASGSVIPRRFGRTWDQTVHGYEQLNSILTRCHLHIICWNQLGQKAARIRY